MIAMISYIVAAFLSFSVAQAAPTLDPIPAPPAERLPIEEGGANYACDQVLSKLEEYNRMARDHDTSITGFLGQVTEKVNSWYTALSPLEGTTQTLEAGTFAPLQDGAAQISSITDAAYDNSSLLAQEMDRLILSVKDCLKTPQSRRTKK